MPGRLPSSRLGTHLVQRPADRVVGRPGILDRPPLPSGHPVSWGAITDGTVLDHAPYPYPVWGQSCLASPPPRLPGLWYIS